MDKLAILPPLLTSLINAEPIYTDHWPNTYTDMSNVYQTVDEQDFNFSFEKGHLVPSWLNGEYWTVGPGKFEWGPSKYNGWLDGTAVSTKVTIKNGGDQLRFQRKFQETKTYKANKAAGDIVITEIGTYGEPEDLIDGIKNPVKQATARLEYYFTHLTDNTIVNLFELCGHVVAFSEVPGITLLDRETLETVANLDLGTSPKVPDNLTILTQLAHGYVDQDNNFLNAATGLLQEEAGQPPVPVYMLYQLKDASKPRTPEEFINDIEFSKLVKIPGVDTVQYFHQGALTEDYFIMPFNNVEFDSMCLFGKIGGAQPMNDCMRVNTDLVPTFVVFDRRTMEEVSRFTTDYFVSFHMINAFQDPMDKNKIVIDSSEIKEGSNPFDVFDFNVVNATGQELIDNYNKFLLGMLPKRMVLDLTTGGEFVQSSGLFTNALDNDEWPSYMQAGSDFPQVSPVDFGKDYDHFYTNGAGAMIPDRIYHSIISTQQRYVWQEVGYHVTEIEIVMSPDQKSSVVVALNTPFAPGPECFLVVLDGESLQELGRAYLPKGVNIAGTAHTTWMALDIEDPVTEDPGSGSIGSVFMSSLLLFVGVMLF